MSFRCAIVASFAAPYASNFVHSMIDFAVKVKRDGGDACFVLPYLAKNREWLKLLDEKDIKTYFISEKPYSLKTVAQLKKIFKEQRVNVVYSHFAGYDFACKFAAGNRLVIWHCRMNVNISTKLKRIKYFIKHKILGKNVVSIALSDDIKRKIERYAPKGMVYSVPNAIELSRLEYNPKCLANPKKYLMFGWEPKTKGLDIVLNVFDKNIEELKDKELYVSAQEKTINYVLERYGEGNLPKWLHLLEPTNNIASVYEKGDCLIVSSRSEGFCCCLAEALYSGLSAIISNIENLDWALEFNNVKQFDLFDEDSLIKAITSKFDNSQSLYSENRDRVFNQYGMESWSNMILEIISKHRK